MSTANPTQPGGEAQSRTGALPILGAGVATGATAGLLAAILTPAIRRWAGVSDRDLINGASVVAVALGLWVLCSVVDWLLAPHVPWPEAWAAGLAVIIGVIATLAIYGNDGPSLLTPYPTRFASLAVPLIVLLVAGGAALFAFFLRLPVASLKLGASGMLVAALVAGGVVYFVDRRGAVHYTLTTVRAGATVAPAGGARPSGAVTPVATPAPLLLHFTIAPNSQATYTDNEKMARLPAPDDAVGTTQSITGEVWLTPQGLDPNHPSSISVDLRTIKSDQAGRDRQMSNALESDTYPFAVFTIQAITGFPTTYQRGTPVNVTLDGTMALHGQQHPVTWTGTAAYDGTQLEVVLSTQLDMRTYGITPPTSATTVPQPTVKLDVHIYATQQTG